ncbi:MAG: vanadium-dependent haloperoxidase [Deinococcota bacterium]
MNTYRREDALNIRKTAAKLAADRSHPRHVENGDEQKFRRADGTPSYLANFTKGLPHDCNTGLVMSSADYEQFVRAIDSGDPRDFIDTPLGPTPENTWKSSKAQTGAKDEEGNEIPVDVRAWESQSAGLTFDLQGPDAQAVTMPPAPALDSAELTAEMAEVYAQALLRDAPFTDIVSGSGSVTVGGSSVSVSDILTELNKLEWFAGSGQLTLSELTPAELRRKRGPLTLQNAFRGVTQGDDIGPYISQFLLAGNTGINSRDEEYIHGVPGQPRTAADGLITYGAINIDQRVRFASPGIDYMTTWKEWFDVQQGADLRELEDYEKEVPRRFITTPRDLATYVHYDALYEAYLNACLLMLAKGIPFDPGIPFTADDITDHQQGFAQFGGPHILSLVTEVATRALKAVRYQKFNVHRRFRPEALAGRLAKVHEPELNIVELTSMVSELQPILNWVDAKNGADTDIGGPNYLLPMAFCEGSPMHPSYGAGHATVAGACVTILKAFFDHARPLTLAGDDTTAFVPNSDGLSLTTVPVTNGRLTVEGELNKLASNISIGRDWAGVHFFSDYLESIRMGEQIAIGILEEQKLTYGENFSMTVPLYDGGTVRI